jgi:predicted transcriptional regulator
MKIIKIGIAPQEKIRERALAIASGDIKLIPSDPKIWFTSVDSLSRVVRDENRVLWDVVCSTLPPST